MSVLVRITEQDVRGAMREPRYWSLGHPERQAFNAWVGQAWRGLNPADGEARSTVWVRAYMREGHMVSAHWRSAPPRNGLDQHAGLAPPNRPEMHDPIERVSRGPTRPRLPNGGSSSSRPGGPPSNRLGVQRERREDSSGQDRVEGLRRDPETQHRGTLQHQIDQWDRPGGAAGRDADLRMLGAGPPDVMANGALRYLLPNGSIATARRSTTPNAGSELTLEIAHPSENAGRFIRTDKFRYPDMVRSQTP